MSARDAALRAFALSVLGDLIQGENRAARAEVIAGLQAMLADTGADRIRINLPDGTEIASATLAKPKDRVEITDHAAWIAYVAAHHPAHVKVAYDFERGWLNHLVVEDGDVIDPTTAAIVEFARHVPARDTTPSLRITPTRAPVPGKDLLMAAWRDGALSVTDLFNPAQLPTGERTNAQPDA